MAATGALLAFQAEGQAQSFKEWGLKVWNKMMEPDEIQGIETTASLWRVSGFYIFNHRKFSYPSAYTGKLVQKKSAGSFLVGAKYLHSNIRLPEQSTVVSSLVLDLIGYSTHQVSIGAGYSFNWVLYHRDAQTSKDIRRLRNLTFVNEMRMTHLTETGKVSSPSKAIWPIASVA